MSKWRCGVCGIVLDVENPPEVCPKCGAPREKFTQIPEDQVKLIDRSRFTNGLHIELFTLMAKVAELAQKGIDDNLDPPCVKIFTEAKEQALLFQQKIKAEIQGHISKGKWG
ncbi:MAG: rubredoxin-like domain-containing protein [bacterium]